MIELRTDQAFKAIDAGALTANISIATDAPALVGASTVAFEAIGGSSTLLRVDAAAFASMSLAPFNAAPLALTATQWSGTLNAAVAAIPIQKASVRCV